MYAQHVEEKFKEKNGNPFNKFTQILQSEKNQGYRKLFQTEKNRK